MFKLLSIYSSMHLLTCVYKMAKLPNHKMTPNNPSVNQKSGIHEGSAPVGSQSLPEEQGYRKRGVKRVRERTTFMLPLDLKRRLKHYLADHPGEMSEVTEEVLDKFLRDKGY